MKGQKKPTWLRWLMLAVALGLCWTVWSEMQEYARLGEQAIFSETEWTELLSGRGFVWVVRGIMIFLFLSFWDDDRNISCFCCPTIL